MIIEADLTLIGKVAPWLAGKVSALDEKFGLRITQASSDLVSGWAEVESNTQIAGLWHGGASAVMVETLGSLAACIYAGDSKAAVGIELNVSHLRPVKSGRVIGVASAVRLGSTTATYEVKLFNESDSFTHGDPVVLNGEVANAKLICIGRITCALVAVEP